MRVSVVMQVECLNMLVLHNSADGVFIDTVVKPTGTEKLEAA